MDYRDMEMLIYGMDSAINDYAFTEYYVLQQRFHNIFITGSGNKELMITIAHLKKNFIRQTYNPIDQEKFKPILVEVNNGHKKILELLKSKDLSGLEAYLRNQHWGPHNASYETI